MPENRYRSHLCHALRATDAGKEVRLSGWVHRKRDHGGLLFLDLRDHYGMTQLVVEPDSACFADVAHIHVESCLSVRGTVVKRDESAVNARHPTGEIEVRIKSVEILAPAEDLPLPVFGEPDYPEDIRFRYRYLDLRREGLHGRIVMRNAIVARIREQMHGTGFDEFHTPILTASSPEGARDFLVPSRLHPGRFYALPQAPQIFKQLVMTSGFDRYFQIAPCFRDEDARADRAAGEFYQLDLEMGFVEQEDVLSTLEPIMHALFTHFSGKEVAAPFVRLSYAEAMRAYGCDKPDLRNPLRMHDVTDHFRSSGFRLFATMIERNAAHRIKAIRAPGAGKRAFCDRMNGWAKEQGQPGLGYIMLDENAQGKGPIARNIGPEACEALSQNLGLVAGDAAFFIAGLPSETAAFCAAALGKLGEACGLVEDGYRFCWIVDYPMYAWNGDEKRFDFAHNPFSMPQGGMEALQQQDPAAIKAYQYDLVCNGYEIGSGAIRNHQVGIMYEAFRIAGYGREAVERRFGGLLNAFRYGPPPHGGCAFGIERIVMLLTGSKNIRDITLFPMNQQGEDLLLGAPAEAEAAQLRDVHVAIKKPPSRLPGGGKE